MNVSQLIRKLKKMPPRAHVVWRDHDQSLDEMNGEVQSVQLGEDELRQARIKAGDDDVQRVVLS